MVMTATTPRVFNRKTAKRKTFYISLVKTYLIERGITVAWFCKQVGITPDAFSKIETGKRNAHSLFRAAASMALGEDEKNLALKVVVPSRENIDIERDPKDPRRIISVSIVEMKPSGVDVSPIWKLEEAPWRARV
jgi:transcriptional regulator with XRE-family HTH domain